MGCFFETAKQKIYNNYSANNNKNNNKHNTNFNKTHNKNNKSNNKSNNNSTNGTTIQHLTSLPSTKVLETIDCNGSITSLSKDINKDNDEHHCYRNKILQEHKKQSRVDSAGENIKVKTQPAEVTITRTPTATTTKTAISAAAVPAIAENKLKICKERSKLRQQQEQKQQRQEPNSAAPASSANEFQFVDRKEEEQEVEEEEKAESKQDKQDKILHSSLFKSKTNDTKNFQQNINSYCLLPAQSKNNNYCNNKKKQNKNNYCCSANSNNCLLALHKQISYSTNNNNNYNNNNTNYNKSSSQRNASSKDIEASATTTSALANQTSNALANACGGNQYLPEMLLYARDHLATYLSVASVCFTKNLTNCISAAIRRRRKQNAYAQKTFKKQTQQHRQCQQQQLHEPVYQKTKLSHEVGYNKTTTTRQHLIINSNEYSVQSCNAESCHHHHRYRDQQQQHQRHHTSHMHQTSSSNSFSFYAASSVILVLCYLSTAASAINAPIDKHPIFDESSSDKEILDLLLEKERYDKRLLPPVNGTLTVNVNVLLLSLASPDESSLKYEVEFLLNQQWNDPRLQYGNKSEYEFLNALHHHDNIWTPDTYFIMHGDFKDPIIPMHFALRIYRNGTILYAMRRHLILSCQGSLHIFPFDDPKCSFSMESISYEEPQIKYVWKNDEDTLRKSPSLTTLNAYLIKNQTTACDQNSWRGNYSCLQVELTFTRDRAYYFTTVFIPGIILVTSSFITFWLEWNAVPARVMIGVTTMLNFFTTSNGFRSTLPVVSNLTAMNVWDGVCMCFIYASLLEFVCVNYVGRKRPLHNVVYRPGENPVTQRLPAVLSRIGVILASPLEIIEREFHAALSSEKAAASTATSATAGGQGSPSSISSHIASRRNTRRPTPFASSATGATAGHAGHAGHGSHGGHGLIGAAVQHLRSRSIKYRRNQTTKNTSEPFYTEPVYMSPTTVIPAAQPTVQSRLNETTITTKLASSDVGDQLSDSDSSRVAPQMRHSRSMSTNTPPLVLRDGMKSTRPLGSSALVNSGGSKKNGNTNDDKGNAERPIKPPRKKTSRSTSPAKGEGGVYFIEIPLEVEERAVGDVGGEGGGGGGGGSGEAQDTASGEKRRETSAPNEIVACTSCGGGSSPCTHSANNGCATETCFVQVRKKEPPHPIRVAKTIDVIARITFPTAYSIFLIFFFVHYKGFS